ncbi:MAG: 30S ribosomal protein S8e [Candidatus Nanosalina sp.]
MAVRHDRSETKKSGGKTRSYRKSKKYDLGSEFSSPKLGDDRKVELKDARGNTVKRVVRKEATANLSVDGEVKNVDIEAVLENPANDNYVRRSLLTKGTIVRTEEGKARITSRPGQDGVINAELIEE